MKGQQCFGGWMSMMLCVALVGSLGITVPAAAETYTSGLVNYFGGIPFAVAQEKGFYSAEGASILQRFYTSTEWYQALLNKKNDMIMVWSGSGLDLLLDGHPYVIVGAIHQDAGGVRMVIKQGTNPEEISRIGIPNDDATWKWVGWKYLQEAGQSLEGKRFITLTLEELTANFLNGRLPAVATVWSQDAETMVADGDGEIVFSNEDYPDTFLIVVAFEKERYAAMPKDDLKAFWRGMIAALEWINVPENLTECRTLLAEGSAREIVTGIETDEAFAEQLANHKYFRRDELQQVNAALRNTMQGLLDFRKEVLGMDIQDFNLEEWVDTSVLLEVLSEMP